MGFLSSKFSAPLTVNPVPHKLPTKNCLDSFVQNFRQRILTPENFDALSLVYSSFVLQMLVNKTRFRPHVLSHTLWRPRLAPKPVVITFAAAMSNTDVAMPPQPLLSGIRVDGAVHRRLLQKHSGSLAAVPLTVRGGVRRRRRHTESQHEAVRQDG